MSSMVTAEPGQFVTVMENVAKNFKHTVENAQESCSSIVTEA